MNVHYDLLVERVSTLNYNPEPIVISPSTPVRTAIELMKSNNKGNVLVCEGKKLLGILTERDILLRIFGEEGNQDKPVGDMMTANPVTVHLDDVIAEAVKKMRSGTYRHLPIVDSDGCPIGILSMKHIVHFLVEHFPEEVYNLTPNPDEALPAPEGA